MLELVSLSKHYGSVVALHDVSLRVPAGQFVGILGRSGAGKSTMLSLIHRLTPPTAGHILWEGNDTTALRGSALLDWRAHCGMIFQQFHLVPRLDAFTNVLLGSLRRQNTLASLVKYFRHEDRILALEALDAVGMLHKASHRPTELSGGEQQRVAIARALLQKPRLLLADEPIAALDQENSRVVMELLRRICDERGITVLCNLHSVAIAREYSHRLLGIAAGRLVFDGSPAELTQTQAAALYAASPAAAPSRALSPAQVPIARPVMEGDAH